MLRYVLSFPGELSAEDAHAISALLKEAADDSEWRDLVIANGGTITKMPPARPHRRHRGPRIVRWR